MQEEYDGARLKKDPDGNRKPVNKKEKLAHMCVPRDSFHQ
jgi:hypothetical protein